LGIFELLTFLLLGLWTAVSARLGSDEVHSTNIESGTFSPHLALSAIRVWAPWPIWRNDLCHSTHWSS